jgi:hypothetical protein
MNFLKVKKSASSTAASVKDEDYDELESILHDQSSNSTIVSLDLSQMDDNSPRRKRKYTRHVAPPLEMKTRGVKLPRYSMEKRTRQPRIHMDTDLITQTNTKNTTRKQKSTRNSAFVVSTKFLFCLLQPNVCYVWYLCYPIWFTWHILFAEIIVVNASI